MGDFKIICRTCLSESDNLTSIFKNIKMHNKDLEISEMINTITNLKVNTTDELPKSVCQNCVYQICKSFFFRQQCLESDSTLKSLLNIKEEEVNITLENTNDIESLVIENVKIPESDEIPVKEEIFEVFNDDDDDDVTQDNDDNELFEYVEELDDDMDIDKLQESDYMLVEGDRDELIELLEADISKQNETETNNSNVKKTTKKDDYEDFFKMLNAQTSVLENLFTISTLYDIPLTENEIAINEEMKSKYPYSCYICKNYFESEDFLKEHLKNHIENQEFDCRICELSFKTANTYLNHMRIHTEFPITSFCYFCCYEKHNEDELRLHLEKVHKVFKTHNCFFCEYTFKRSAERKRHMSEAHKDYYSKNRLLLDDLEINEKNQLKSLAFLCELCGKECMSEHAMNLHTLRHNNDKPFKCHICDKSFVLNAYLQDHIIRHNPEKNFKCDICGKFFARKRSLKDHVKRHDGEKPYQCHLCSLKLSTRASLQMHIRTHFGEKPYRAQEARRSPRVRRKKKPQPQAQPIEHQIIVETIDCLE